MYLCVRGIDFASFYDFSEVWYIFFFFILLKFLGKVLRRMDVIYVFFYKSTERIVSSPASKIEFYTLKVLYSCANFGQLLWYRIIPISGIKF
jgi:hypothetical protein